MKPPSRPAPGRPATASPDDLGARLAAIDWAAAWYEPWSEAGEAVAAEVQRGAPVSAALQARVARADAPVCPAFVPQQALPAGEPYEGFIAREQRVPTRENAHDLFNGLVWLRFPRTKRRLNALHAEWLAREGVGARRGPVRDAATLFDEDSALLFAPDDLWQALALRHWTELLSPQGSLRERWRTQARLLVFGHAALEKLMTPYKSITVHVWRVDRLFEPGGDLRALDDALAVMLTSQRLASKPFVPLPVLGVPDWWATNGEPDFYADAGVFRPLRQEAGARGIRAARP